MSTFTVYCHGTGYNRVKSTEEDELVAWFHNRHPGNEVTLAGNTVSKGDFLVNEGVGHEGNQLPLPQQVNPITGDLRTGSQWKPTTLFKKPTFADHLKGNTHGKQALTELRGKVSGDGWDENTVRTVNVIQKLKFEEGQPIDTVNLVGWSRGAVTCMRIANLLYEVFKESIECNIFAVDPVAGQDAGIFMGDTRKLQSNVARYVGILAMHERRESFKPQDWSRVNASHAKWCIFLPMPGVHAAQVTVQNPPDAAYITRNLACGLLQAWGTPVKGKPFNHLSTPLDMSVAYARLVLSLSEHKSYETGFSGRFSSVPILRRREFATHSKMDIYTRGGKESYWINEHHRACFAAAFPDVYDAIFESKQSAEVKLGPASRFAKFSAAVNRHKALHDSLVAKGLLSDSGTNGLWMGIGAGRYTNQLYRTWPPASAGFPLHA